MGMTNEEIQAQLDAEMSPQAGKTGGMEMEKEKTGRLRLKTPAPATPARVAAPVFPAQTRADAAPEKKNRSLSAFLAKTVLLIAVCAVLYFFREQIISLAGIFRKQDPVRMETAVVPGKKTQPVAVDRPPPAQKVTCPTCNGAGKHQIPGSTLASSTYPCPVCSGKGSRIMDIPEGFVACPDCRGFGRIGETDDFFQSRQRYTSVVCDRCKGRGRLAE